MIGVSPLDLLVFIAVSLGFIAKMPRPRTPRQVPLAALLYLFVLGLSIAIGNTLAAITLPLIERDPYLCLIVSVVLFGFIQVLVRKPSA